VLEYHRQASKEANMVTRAVKVSRRLEDAVANNKMSRDLSFPFRGLCFASFGRVFTSWLQIVIEKISYWQTVVSTSRRIH
jgi:hypothetical protein